ncbi:2-amino-4-hydroxy-6-hydroxymethyldihydropteridine diphosphokinase [Tepidibacillus infernus]|uniref:2-amino-4-hydroxy-6- hydroxymethyldihydropteridine diphosphokinase n=1 Tax=Tepidibacillus infernus TaxID=1806172 RepID=UPI003B6B6BF4
MRGVYLGLGSNMGDRYQYLRYAIDQLNQHPNVKVIEESSIYETEPFGNKEQPDFLNIVIEVETNLQPKELLEYIQTVEQNLGRTREIHWGPRTIDIDILLFGDKIINDKDLIVPHPYLTKRLFVLIPLSEIYDQGIPGYHITIQEMIKKLDQKERLEKYERYQ